MQVYYISGSYLARTARAICLTLALLCSAAPASALVPSGQVRSVHGNPLQVNVVHYLSKLHPVSTGSHKWNWGYPYRKGSIEIDGTTYSNSVMHVAYYSNETDPVGAYAWADYNLARKCTYLRGVKGISDRSPDPHTRATWTVFGDGKVLSKHTLGFGVAQPTNIDVTGVLRLQIRVTIVVRGRATYGWGNARVVCSS
jgi:hypothetical protein